MKTWLRVRHVQATAHLVRVGEHIRKIPNNNVTFGIDDCSRLVYLTQVRAWE